METAWVARGHYFKQKTIVCSRIDKETKQYVGNSDKVFNSLPSADRWAKRVYEQRTRIVITVLCGSQTKGLA